MKHKKDDPVALVLSDYMKIAQNNDWMEERRQGEVAAKDYLGTVKALVEAKRYSHQATAIIESLMEEVDTYKSYISELESMVSKLNETINDLLRKIENLEKEKGS